MLKSKGVLLAIVSKNEENLALEGLKSKKNILKPEDFVTYKINWNSKYENIIKRNAVFVLMGIELMLNGAHLNLAAFSRFDDKMEGQVLAVFSIVLAAAEVSIALAILLNIYKTHKTSDLDDLTDLKH